MPSMRRRPTCSASATAKLAHLQDYRRGHNVDQRFVNHDPGGSLMRWRSERDRGVAFSDPRQPFHIHDAMVDERGRESPSSLPRARQQRIRRKPLTSPCSDRSRLDRHRRRERRASHRRRQHVADRQDTSAAGPRPASSPSRSETPSTASSSGRLSRRNPTRGQRGGDHGSAT
jgi:hypothetical protein